MTEPQSEENQQVAVKQTNKVSSGLIKFAWFYAAQNGYADIVSSLIKANINVDVADRIGYTALISAAFYGFSEVARKGCNKIASMLINAKANINAVDKYGDSALIYAATEGKEKIVSMLIDANKKNIEAADEDEKAALIDAAYNFRTTALLNAAKQGHSEIVSMLVNATANIEAIDGYGRTSLIYAAKRGYNKVVSALINANANIEAADTYGKTPLIYAAYEGHNEVLSTLIKASANKEAVDTEGKTAWIYSAKRGLTEIALTLIDAKANIEAVDKRGNTALIIAAKKGHNKLVSALINAGANINAVDKDGNTALIIAVKKGHNTMLPLFFKANVNIDAGDKQRSGIIPDKKKWQDFLAMLLERVITDDPGAVDAFVTFLKYCPSGKQCRELWKSCPSNLECGFGQSLDWLQDLPTRFYFNLVMEKGVCYLICSYCCDKGVSLQSFWKRDEGLMLGIVSDMPDDAWSNTWVQERILSNASYGLDASNAITVGLKSKNPWDLNRRLYFANNWDRSKNTGINTKATHYRTLNLLDSSDKVSVRELKILQEEMSKMHGHDQYDVVEATLVYNEILTESFGRYNVVVKHRHQELPALFKKQGWRDDIKKKYKEGVYSKYNAIPTLPYQSTDNQDSSEAGSPVIMMVHGTSEAAAYSIVKAGFGTVSALDAGYYGQGIYFTRSIKYAASYDTTGGRKEKTLILSLVTPGNVFPVKPTDTLRGQPIKPGYQSHYTLVDRKGRPVTEDEVTSAVYDELVVGQDTQAVARYIIKVAPKPSERKNKKKTKKAKKTAKKTVSERKDNDSDDDLSDDEDNFISNRKLWGAHVGTTDDQQSSTNDAKHEVDTLKKSSENFQQTNSKQQQSVNLTETVNNLQQENLKLKEDNINLSQTITSLLAKIAQLEGTNK